MHVIYFIFKNQFLYKLGHAVLRWMTFIRSPDITLSCKSFNFPKYLETIKIKKHRNERSIHIYKTIHQWIDPHLHSELVSPLSVLAIFLEIPFTSSRNRSIVICFRSTGHAPQTFRTVSFLERRSSFRVKVIRWNPCQVTRSKEGSEGRREARIGRIEGTRGRTCLLRLQVSYRGARGPVR